MLSRHLSNNWTKRRVFSETETPQKFKTTRREREFRWDLISMKSGQPTYTFNAENQGGEGPKRFLQFLSTGGRKYARRGREGTSKVLRRRMKTALELRSAGQHGGVPGAEGGRKQTLRTKKERKGVRQEVKYMQVRGKNEGCPFYRENQRLKPRGLTDYLLT